MDPANRPAVQEDLAATRARVKRRRRRIAIGVLLVLAVVVFALPRAVIRWFVEDLLLWAAAALAIGVGIVVAPGARALLQRRDKIK